MAPGARLVLWNRLAERGPDLATAGLWRCLNDVSSALHRRDQLPFYRALVVGEALPVPTPARAQGLEASRHG
jgi:hypothetical protein